MQFFVDTDYKQFIAHQNANSTPVRLAIFNFEQLVMDQLPNGGIDEMLFSFNQLTTTYEDQLNNLSHQQVEDVLIEIVCCCSDAALTIGVSHVPYMYLRDYFINQLHRQQNLQANLLAIAKEIMLTFGNKLASEQQQHRPYSKVTLMILEAADTIPIDQLTPSAISKQLRYSTSYISRLFKQETGESLMSFITKNKIKIALHLLTTSALSIADIATTLGFYDSSAFIHAFKKTCHETPSHYRKNHQFEIVNTKYDPTLPSLHLFS
ncbi:helix-turn-helix domain-containing protein [Furfurilactobacillus curtus]|uniref:HTH araC/xylS-type domain-containing protein n=1 Tax=Furfurilactobacillus curtus TaxID=1746200 RepID=A0ABQ5JMV4_9LACO